MFDTLKLVFDTFGKDLMVPVMIFIICMIFKAPAKKAFSSAVLVGVGLKGMTFITTEFGAVLSPLVQQLIATTGLNLKALDIGWQAVASVAYSTDIGMMFIGVGLLFQIILWLVKWTDIFMPSDLWNNYSIIVWGSMFFAIKENLAVAFVLMLFINVVTLLIAEVMQKRWSTYYHYPGCAMTAPHHMGDAPMYLVLNIIGNKIGLDKIKADPASIKKKFGFMGEPMYIGLIVGCRNAMIVSPHPAAKNVTIHGVNLINAALEELGAPENLIQVIEAPSMDATKELMQKVDVIVATGGHAMVKSAYSSGRPSYGVGQGNVQVIVAEDYTDYDKMAATIVGSRAYDNGIPCTGEQAVHFPKEKYDEFVAAMKRAKAAMIPDDKVDELPKILFKENGAIDAKHVGMKPVKLAAEMGFEVPEDTQILIFNNRGISRENILCREKLCPVIQLFPYESFEQAVADAKTNLLWEGAGHTSVIYTNDTEKAEYVGHELPVGRLVVNQAGGAASGGNYINGLHPTMSLGCGSWGNNSISENLTYKHLMNTTRLAYYHDCTMPELDEVWKL